MAASKPQDPNAFILRCLRDYQDGKHFDLPWDAFVSRKDLPAKRAFKRTFIENFFTLGDLAELVSLFITKYLMSFTILFGVVFMIDFQVMINQ